MEDLHKEVLEILDSAEFQPVRITNHLQCDPNAMDVSELRDYLFEVYTICNNKETCDSINTKAYQHLYFI